MNSDEGKMSKAERKQLRRALGAPPQARAGGGGFGDLAQAERRAAEGAEWEARLGRVGQTPSLGDEPTWLLRERKLARETRRHVALAAAGLPLLLAASVAFAATTPGPNEGLLQGIAAGLVAAGLAALGWVYRRAPTSPMLEVLAHRRSDVVWVYGVETTYNGAVAGKTWTLTAALADGTRASSMGLSPSELPEAMAMFVGAAQGYSDARDAAFNRDPRSVR